MSSEPVFVVGVPRSGTTLLAAMLGAHSRLHSGPETQFFNKLSDARLRECVADPYWPNQATEAVASLTLAGQSVATLFETTVHEIQRFLSQQQPGVAPMLESLTRTLAQKRGKGRWVEKTPNHLLHVDRLRREYPGSPVVRIVRDPRDSALSMRKLPWASQSVIYNGLLIQLWFAASSGFFASDPRTLTVLYEALVQDPERELRRVCAFLDEAFEPAMLDTRVSAAQVSSFKESWKRQVAERIDSSHIQWWRRTLDERTARALTYCCLPFIRSFGYEVFDEPRFSLKAYALSKASIEKYEQRFVDAAEAGIRLLHWEDPEEPSRRELVVLDAEEQVRRVRPLVALVRALVRGWIRGEPLKAYYGSSGSRGGWLTRVLLNALERQEAGPVH